jgi:hypothetical protein
MFATTSARRRSTNSISGRVAQSTDIPKSRFGSYADIRPLELDFSRECDGDGTGCGEITFVTGENLVEWAKAAGKQAMRVPILGRARPGCDRCGQAVALQDVDPFKVLGEGAGSRQPADPGADNNRPPAQLTRVAVACPH